MKESDNCNDFIRYWESLDYNENSDFARAMVKALAIVWSTTK